MNESFRIPGPEKAETLRSRAVALYSKLREERKVTHPDDLTIDDSEMAELAYEKWLAAEDNRIIKGPSEEDKTTFYEVQLSKDLFFVDAGFTDPEFLETPVLFMLRSTLELARKNRAPLEMIEKIKSQIVLVQDLIDQQKPQD